MSWHPEAKSRMQNRQIKSFSGTQQGQIVVEYILLLVIAVTLALVITTTLVSRNEDSPGFMIRKWRAIIEVIGADQ